MANIQLASIKDLLPSRTGWLWTEQSSIVPKNTTKGFEWPRITIVTPSYNQGQFLEETIRSVLLQGYPNLEYIIIDGGSTDNSVEIIKKYAPWLSYWVSEKDSGQTEAINKGFARSTGQIMGWVNSDDLLVKDALYKLGCVYKPGIHWWHGEAQQMLADRTIITFPKYIDKVNHSYLLHARLIIPQIATYWTRELWNKVGASLNSFNMAMDYDLWLRFSAYAPAHLLNDVLGIYRTHDMAKTGTSSGLSSYLDEVDSVRLDEYRKLGYGRILRFVYITVWTRLYLAKFQNWRSFFGRRQIPYV